MDRRKESKQGREKRPAEGFELQKQTITMTERDWLESKRRDKKTA